MLLVAPACPDDAFAVSIEATLEAGTDEGSAIGCDFGALHGEVESESAVCGRFLSSYHARVK